MIVIGKWSSNFLSTHGHRPVSLCSIFSFLFLLYNQGGGLGGGGGGGSLCVLFSFLMYRMNMDFALRLFYVVVSRMFYSIVTSPVPM